MTIPPQKIIEQNKLQITLLKLARVFNLKLAFTERDFHNLVILIKLCKIRYLNLDKAYRETRLFVWKIENFDELQLP